MPDKNSVIGAGQIWELRNGTRVTIIGCHPHDAFPWKGVTLAEDAKVHMSWKLSGSYMMPGVEHERDLKTILWPPDDALRHVEEESLLPNCIGGVTVVDVNGRLRNVPVCGATNWVLAHLRARTTETGPPPVVRYTMQSNDKKLHLTGGQLRDVARDLHALSLAFEGIDWPETPQEPLYKIIIRRAKEWLN